ncbi:HNH endonuclease [Streptomyces sp. VTCC 41912]|uniref:HNH endonuclease n=1 Tax=Streptomyces sp. VTCC 41912 TaxID=3383243 RepID=UPI003896D6E0
MSNVEHALAYVQARSIRVPHGCRYWMAALTSDGYAKAVITTEGRERTVRVHRWLYEQVVGPNPLPAAIVTAHACNEALCVEATHLSGATQRTNLAQMAAQGRSAGRAHHGRADTRGPLGRAQAIQAALRDGLDLPALAAAMREGDPRPLVRQALAHGYKAEAYLAAVEASDPSAAQLPLF